MLNSDTTSKYLIASFLSQISLICFQYNFNTFSTVKVIISNLNCMKVKVII